MASVAGTLLIADVAEVRRAAMPPRLVRGDTNVRRLGPWDSAAWIWRKEVPMPPSGDLFLKRLDLWMGFVRQDLKTPLEAPGDARRLHSIVQLQYPPFLFAGWRDSQERSSLATRMPGRRSPPGFSG